MYELDDEAMEMSRYPFALVLIYLLPGLVVGLCGVDWLWAIVPMLLSMALYPLAGRRKDPMLSALRTVPVKTAQVGLLFTAIGILAGSLGSPVAEEIDPSEMPPMVYGEVLEVDEVTRRNVVYHTLERPDLPRTHRMLFRVEGFCDLPVKAKPTNSKTNTRSNFQPNARPNTQAPPQPNTQTPTQRSPESNLWPNLEASTESNASSGRRNRPVSNRLALIYLNEYIAPPEPHDRVMFVSNLDTLRDTGNFQNPDYLRSLRQRGVTWGQHLSSRDELIRLAPRFSLARIFYKMRLRFAEAIDSSGISPATASFLKTLLIGEAGAIDHDERQLFADAGISHILAVSGLHIGIISSLIAILTMPLLLLSQRRLRLCLTILLTWLYVALCGMHYPAVRATIMLTALVIAKLLERPGSSLNALCLSLCVILVADPIALFDVGLQMSALCIIALIAIADPLLLPLRRDRYKSARIINAYAVTLIIFFCSWPVMAYYFHALPTMFLPVNLLAVPLLPVYLCVALLHTATCALGLQISFLAKLLDLGHDSLTAFCSLVAGNSSLPLRVTLVTPALWLTAIGVTTYALRRPSRKTAVAATAALILAVATIWIFPAEEPARGYIIQSTYNDLSIARYSSAGDATDVWPIGDETRLTLSGLDLDIAAKGTLQRLCLLEKSDTTKPRPTDILLVARGYNGPGTLLLKGYAPRLVAIHPSVYPQAAERLAGELREAGVRVVDMREEGAVRLLDQ